MVCPKLLQMYTLQQIGQSLTATFDKRLIMTSSEKLLKIDSFPGTNFSGIYGHEAMDDHIT
ncbi:hypothetical protein ACHAXS_000737 [Conticribra weissflogii]